jgi:hypothetical protein
MTMLVSDMITVVGLVVAFALFLGMALKELRLNGGSAIRQLKFQMAVATFVWLSGESLSVFDTVAYGANTEFLGIHTVAMAIFAFIVLTRLPRFLKH